MLIYIFAEHYPNPYKPQFDTEFAYLLRQGHTIRIFATGQYTDTVHPRVREYGLDGMTVLFPTTLRTLPKFLVRMTTRVLSAPVRSIHRARAIWIRRDSVKQNFMRVARSLLLPLEAPDLSYIHNIATAEHLDFLGALYPSSRVMLYFHGGEVGGVKRVVRDQELFTRMQVVLTNSEFSRKQAISRGCPADRVFVVPVGFDLSDYPAVSSRRYRPTGVLRLISIGRLSEEKGLIFALEAIERLIANGQGAIHYTIVGRGLLEESLRREVAERGLASHVAFVGEQDKAGVVAHLGESDVLLLPSLVTDTWAETQAAVVQESMFMRVLVIATRTGGVPESSADVLRQFSVEPGDPAAIAEMIKRIIALPDAELHRIADIARTFAVERFSIEATGVQLLAHGEGRVRTAAESSPQR